MSYQKPTPSASPLILNNQDDMPDPKQKSDNLGPDGILWISLILSSMQGTLSKTNFKIWGKDLSITLVNPFAII